MERITKEEKFFSHVHIQEDKITNYLLNEEHPTGKGKAKFFISFGFSPNSPYELSGVLSEHPKTAKLLGEEPTDWGIRYTFACNIMTPKGSCVCIVSVWQVDNQTTTLRFITAYPDKKAAN